MISPAGCSYPQDKPQPLCYYNGKVGNKIKKQMKTTKVIIAIVLLVLMLDVFVFGLWVMSGQRPPDDMFIGMGTAKILRVLTD
jgi:hypothetical protein